MQMAIIGLPFDLGADRCRVRASGMGKLDCLERVTNPPSFNGSSFMLKKEPLLFVLQNAATMSL